MPIFWHYLLRHYIKIFLLCVIAFITILLTMRLDEIAQFATLGPQGFQIIWFAMQQIPYIIPIAIPISALIASILLVQNFSNSRELTAMRAAGFSLLDLFTPILFAALFLSLLNFYLVSEVSTVAHLNVGTSKTQLRAINPLLLMSNKHVMKLKGFYFDVMGPSRVGEYVQDLIFVSPNKHSNRVNMMIAKQLKIADTSFIGDKVTFLTSQEVKNQEVKNQEVKNLPLEQIILENVQQVITKIDDFTQFLEKKTWSLNHDHLRFSQLLVRKKETQLQLTKLIETKAPREEIKTARNLLYSANNEMTRRISVGIAVFTFTLLGLSFGINISRQKKNQGVFYIIVLSTFYLIAFFAAKSFEYTLIIASLLYLVPHLTIWSASFWTLKRISKGIE